MRVNVQCDGLLARDPKEEARFLALVQKTPGCWNWIGCRWNGYGFFAVSHSENVRAHRQAYSWWKGPIPEGKLVCHSCDNRACVNPDHLWLGTYKDNAVDAGQKGHMSRDWQTHNMTKLTPEKVLEIRHKNAHGITKSELAREYGVTKTAIYLIVVRKNWKNI